MLHESEAALSVIIDIILSESLPRLILTVDTNCDYMSELCLANRMYRPTQFCCRLVFAPLASSPEVSSFLSVVVPASDKTVVCTKKIGKG